MASATIQFRISASGGAARACGCALRASSTKRSAKEQRRSMKSAGGIRRAGPMYQCLEADGSKRKVLISSRSFSATIMLERLQFARMLTKISLHPCRMHR
jgi:hypothetical protein